MTPATMAKDVNRLSDMMFPVTSACSQPANARSPGMGAEIMLCVPDESATRWLSGSGVYICWAIANSVVRQRWLADSWPEHGAAERTSRPQSGAVLRERETRSPLVYSPSGRSLDGSQTSSASFSPVTCVPGTACA